jgi:hypothetical protein
MAMLRAAIDCSQDGGRKFFVMAALVSSAEEWVAFDVEWRQRLAKDSLPYFHMNPFAHANTHPQKPFDDSWIGKESRRQALLQDLLDIIGSHAWKKCGCIIPLESFLMFSDPVRQEFFPTMIATAARLIWPDIEIWRRREKFQQQAEMIFEDGDEGKGSLIEAIKDMTGQSPSFRSKKDTPTKGIVGFTALQASDILAFEMQTQTKELGKPIDEVHFRFPYVQLERIPGDIRVLKSEGTRVMEEGMKVVKYFSDNPLGSTVQ